MPDAKSRRGAAITFPVLLLVGGVLSAFFLYQAGRYLAARGWRETPCTILKSEVRVHKTRSNPTYSVALEYEYEADGRTHSSSRYEFFSGSSSGREGKKAVVDRLPPGTRTVCYVNPSDPTDAVFDRGFHPLLLIGLLPLAMAAIGAVGVFRLVRRKLDPLA